MYSECGQLDFQSGHDVIHADLADIIKDFHENKKAHLERSMCMTCVYHSALMVPSQVEHLLISSAN